MLWLKINSIGWEKKFCLKKYFRAIILFFKWNLHLISFSIWLQHTTWHPPLLNPTSILRAVCCSFHPKEQPDNPDDNWHSRRHRPRGSYPTTWTAELQDFLSHSKDDLVNEHKFSIKSGQAEQGGLFQSLLIIESILATQPPGRSLPTLNETHRTQLCSTPPAVHSLSVLELTFHPHNRSMPTAPQGQSCAALRKIPASHDLCSQLQCRWISNAGLGWWDIEQHTAIHRKIFQYMMKFVTF